MDGRSIGFGEHEPGWLEKLPGLSGRDILDTVEVISYVNYINRVADALGIDPEPEMREAFARWSDHS
jgi:hypothetical protein